MNIKIIRKVDDGPEQMEVYEAREIQNPFMSASFQILSDGPHLGKLINWLDAVVVDKT